MSERKNLVFVYGTLKRGFGNWSWALKDNSDYLGDFVTDTKYTMYSLGGFPGVVEGGTTPISGQVFCVDDNVMRSLDSLEGFPSFYNRKQINTSFGKAWIYLLADKERYSSRTIIDDGKWR